MYLRVIFLGKCTEWGYFLGLLDLPDIFVG